MPSIRPWATFTVLYENLLQSVDRQLWTLSTVGFKLYSGSQIAHGIPISLLCIFMFFISLLVLKSCLPFWIPTLVAQFCCKWFYFTHPGSFPCVARQMGQNGVIMHVSVYVYFYENTLKEDKLLISAVIEEYQRTFQMGTKQLALCQPCI